MPEQEMVDLVESSRDGAWGLSGIGGRGWSLMVPVWDPGGRRLLGCLRVEAGGGRDMDIATELEEAPYAG